MVSINKGQANEFQAKIKANNEILEVVINNENVIIVELGKLKLKSIMSTWLQHLQVCAYDIYPRKTKSIPWQEVADAVAARG